MQRFNTSARCCSLRSAHACVFSVWGGAHAVAADKPETNEEGQVAYRQRMGSSRGGAVENDVGELELAGSGGMHLWLLETLPTVAGGLVSPLSLRQHCRLFLSHLGLLLFGCPGPPPVCLLPFGTAAHMADLSR